MLVLINQDLSFYRVQLWNPSDTDYPAMYGVLPPLGRLVMRGGPATNDQNTHCTFQLFNTDLTKSLPSNSGGKSGGGPGHTITIGSSGKKKRKHKKGR